MIVVDFDKLGIIFVGEVLFFGIVFFVDLFGVGIGVFLLGYVFVMMVILVVVMSFLFLFIGMKFGMVLLNMKWL